MRCNVAIAGITGKVDGRPFARSWSVVLWAASCIAVAPVIVRAASPAFDSAADPAYNFVPASDAAWFVGSNGGFGWGSPWFNDGRPKGDPLGIVGSSTRNGTGDLDNDGDINTPRDATGRAWGYIAGPPTNQFPDGGHGLAERLLQGVLSVGQTFSIDVDAGILADPVLADGKHHPGSAGWGLTNLSGDDDRFGLTVGGGVADYLITTPIGRGLSQYDSGIPVTSEGIHCEVTLLGPSNVSPFPLQWRMTLTPLSPGAQTYTFTGTRIGTVIDLIAVGDSGGGSDPANAVYYNNISITGVPEPGSAAVLMAGAALLLRRRR